MAVQDGFGDDRRDIDYEEYLASNERLLKVQVAERLRTDSRARDIWDDTLQEGRLVQWEVLQKRPDAARAYVHAAMANRIGEVLSRGTWTGMPTAQGKPRDPLRRGDRASVDDETLQLDQVVESSDVLDQVLMAYHEGEIHQALDRLTFTQRRAVVARFFYGMSYAEIAAMQGCSKQTVERQWRTEIRPQLAEELARLA
jgi:RNA polymerase sigma factor (sigma-70 family)